MEARAELPKAGEEETVGVLREEGTGCRGGVTSKRGGERGEEDV